MRRLALTAIITAFGATLIFYQVFSQYRYHMDSVSLVEFVASNGEFLAPGESAVKMLDRFVGLEALAACVVYYDNEGTTTRAILDENFSYTTEVWGVSYDAGFNMAIGLPGVLLISTGITGIAVGMLVLGGVCCLIDRAALLASNSPFHSAIGRCSVAAAGDDIGGRAGPATTEAISVLWSWDRNNPRLLEMADVRAKRSHPAIPFAAYCAAFVSSAETERA